MTPFRPGVALVGLMLASAASLPAQGNHWERQVREQLQRAEVALQAKGTRGVAFTRAGNLNTEESASLTVTFEASVSYEIVGVCDNDCTSLGLVLATLSNNDIAADRTGESFPVLHFTPTVTASYRVKVLMRACQLNPCWYGVGVYRK